MMYPYSKQDVEEIVREGLEGYYAVSEDGIAESIVDALERHGVVEYLYTVNGS
jgi:hypothetical protein